LTPLFLDEDRRSVRALLRGVAARSTAEQRLAGLIPTPSLPEKALEALAAQTTISGIVALLTAWSHPFGAPLLDEGRKPKPDLLRLDLTVNAQYAAEALREAKRAPLGSAIRGELTTYVAEMADLENASTALQLASHQSSIDPAQLFLVGGRHLDREQFLAAARAGDPARVRSVLARTFRGTPLAAVFELTSRDFEAAALAAQLRRATAAARMAPLGAAPVVAFWLRLRAQMRDLRSIIWHVALGAPPAGADALLTPV
ncbi:MAG: V-type ATPase subunit, partial [Gemmatimonadaceae bacterium]